MIGAMNLSASPIISNSYFNRPYSLNAATLRLISRRDHFSFVKKPTTRESKV